MLGIEDYGSDVESDASDSSQMPKPPSKASLSSLLPTPEQKKPLPTGPSITNALSLPPPKTKGKKREGPLKITVESLKFSEEGDEPKAKRQRVDEGTGSLGKKGAGSSSLLSMLPAPKKVVPMKDKQSEPSVPTRILGGGIKGEPTGLEIEEYQPPLNFSNRASVGTESEDLSFLPPHLRQSRKKVPPPPTISSQPPAALTKPLDVEDDGIDFFSLGSKPTIPSTSKLNAAPTLVQISSAPTVKDYEPPPPTPYDPYPGYYQPPPGQWAAYEPGLYKKYWNEWNAAYAAANSGKDGKGWEGADRDDLVSIDALAELKKEQLAERERSKNITAPPTIAASTAKPNVKAQKAGGLARTRHQLSTLLAEAYENREAIEEKIAQGRRNQKEAGNKYGF